MPVTPVKSHTRKKPPVWDPCDHQSPALKDGEDITFVWCGKPRGHRGSHEGEDFFGLIRYW
jgi:hypothetical protein